MWCTLRIALMWLLVLAIPAQGFAAASMVHCGSGHGGTLQTHSHAVHSHDGAVASAVPHVHDHEAAASSDPDDADVVTSRGDRHVAKAATARQLTKASCSACASCCTTAARPSPLMTFEAAPVHDFFAPLAPRTVAAFLTGSPERPPRSILV